MEIYGAYKENPHKDTEVRICPNFHISPYVEIVSMKNKLIILFQYGLQKQHIAVYIPFWAPVEYKGELGKVPEIVNSIGIWKKVTILSNLDYQIPTHYRQPFTPM